MDTICDGNWTFSRREIKSERDVSSSIVVDLVVAPNVWSSGIWVRRRFVREIRVKVKLSEGAEARDWIVVSLA